MQNSTAVAATTPSSERTTRLVLGLTAVGLLAGVSILTNPRFSAAAGRPQPDGAARLSRTANTTPTFTLDRPEVRMIDADMLAGHTGIPLPPSQDAQGRSSLGVIVGPALFVWVYGGADGVRYSVADLQGQVLAAGLTGNEVYGAFPEIQIPEMHFGPDGRMCEPVMWAGDAGDL